MRLFTTLLELAAVGLIVAGIAMVFVPAALIVAGLLLLAMSWRVSRPAPVSGLLR